MRQKIENTHKKLIQSAFRFFEKAISEVNQDSEVALVHYAIFLELFLKYRLAIEHWSLIPDKPSIVKYLNGDFVSINASQLVNKIEEVTGNNFFSEEKNVYENIFKSRNKIVHFCFNAGRADITKDILKSSAFVIVRMKDEWRSYFNEFLTDIHDLESKLQNLQSYFQEKYDVVKGTIEQGIECDVCGFSAVDVVDERDYIAYCECKVCGDNIELYNIECDKCSNKMYYCSTISRFNRKCKCGNVINVETAPNTYSDYKDGYGHDWQCPECGSKDVLLINNIYRCMNCGNEDESVYQCEWCSSTLIGPYDEDSFWNGCGICEGRMGHNKDD